MVEETKQTNSKESREINSSGRNLAEQNLLFARGAQWYDKLYETRNLQNTAQTVTQIIEEEKKRSSTEQRESLLDLGCGTGSVSILLGKRYKVLGIDASEQMLHYARKNLQKSRGFGKVSVTVEFLEANLTTFRDALESREKTFNHGVLLFSVIGYLRNKTEVENFVYKLGESIHKGGVIIVEPWYEAGEPLVEEQTWYAENEMEKVQRKVQRKWVEEAGEHYTEQRVTWLFESKTNGMKETVEETYRLLALKHQTLQDILYRNGFEIRERNENLTERRKLLVGVRK